MPQARPGRLQTPPFPQRSGSPESLSLGARHSWVAKLASLPWRMGRTQIVSPGQSPESSQAIAITLLRVPQASSSSFSVRDAGAGLHTCFFAAKRSQQISVSAEQLAAPHPMRAGDLSSPEARPVPVAAPAGEVVEGRAEPFAGLEPAGWGGSSHPAMSNDRASGAAISRRRMMTASAVPHSERAPKRARASVTRAVQAIPPVRRAPRILRRPGTGDALARRWLRAWRRPRSPAPRRAPRAPSAPSPDRADSPTGPRRSSPPRCRAGWSAPAPPT